MQFFEEILAATFSPMIMNGEQRADFPELSLSTSQDAGEIHFQVRNGFGSNISAMVAALSLVRAERYLKVTIFHNFQRFFGVRVRLQSFRHTFVLPCSKLFL